MRSASGPSVVVSHRAEDRLRAGHPWIYRGDVVRASAEAGDVVSIVGARRRVLGHALYSSRSLIALRVIHRGESPPSPSLWKQRLAHAMEYRDQLQIDATACRLVHAEADLLPSLIVDRYGEYLVVQFLSQATDRLRDSICDVLEDLLHPRGILARNDGKVRVLEGLQRNVAALRGEVPHHIAIREGAIEYDVDPWIGQKTGLFLDQRENREIAERYARGRALDCFSYQGGFALHLAREAEHVTAIESSTDAVAALEANAVRNGLTIQIRAANVFDELRDLVRAGKRFETIVLDPPAFAKSKDAVSRAVAGYKEINLRALKLLSPGGVLITCTCSYHVDETRFERIVQDAARDARTTVSVVEKRTQSRDHPVLLGVPETRYLTCLILRRVD